MGESRPVSWHAAEHHDFFLNLRALFAGAPRLVMAPGRSDKSKKGNPMIEDGLYRVSFRTPQGQGTGVASLQKGKLRGGDSMMAYVGSYNEAKGSFEADVRVYQHSQVPGMTSAIGVNEADLHISGTVQGSNVSGTGQAPQVPGVVLQVGLERLHD